MKWVTSLIISSVVRVFDYHCIKQNGRHRIADYRTIYMKKVDDVLLEKKNNVSSGSINMLRVLL